MNCHSRPQSKRQSGPPKGKTSRRWLCQKDIADKLMGANLDFTFANLQSPSQRRNVLVSLLTPILGRASNRPPCPLQTMLTSRGGRGKSFFRVEPTGMWNYIWSWNRCSRQSRRRHRYLLMGCRLLIRVCLLS